MKATIVGMRKGKRGMEVECDFLFKGDKEPYRYEFNANRFVRWLIEASKKNIAREPGEKQLVKMAIDTKNGGATIEEFLEYAETKEGLFFSTLLTTFMFRGGTKPIKTKKGE